MSRGTEVHGEVNTDDASSGVEISLYDWNGGAVTLGSTERLVVTDITLVSAVGGDCSVFLDADNDNALDAGETVLRGTVNAGGGISASFVCTPRAGQPGAKPHVLAPAGDVDVVLTGYILKV